MSNVPDNAKRTTLGALAKSWEFAKDDNGTAKVTYPVLTSLVTGTVDPPTPMATSPVGAALTLSFTESIMAPFASRAMSVVPSAATSNQAFLRPVHTTLTPLSVGRSIIAAEPYKVVLLPTYAMRATLSSPMNSL